MVCGDFKIVTILLGQQAGYTRYPCFLPLWDNRARNFHWHRLAPAVCVDSRWNECCQYYFGSTWKGSISTSSHKIVAYERWGTVLYTLSDPIFYEIMNDEEKRSIGLFQGWRKFLGNTKNLYYKTIVQRMLVAFEDLGCKMSSLS